MCQRLLARNKYLERELFKQRKRVKVNSDIRVRKILSSVFTPGQIKLLLNPNKKKNSSEDIAAAISLRTVLKLTDIYRKHGMCHSPHCRHFVDRLLHSMLTMFFGTCFPHYEA